MMNVTFRRGAQVTLWAHLLAKASQSPWFDLQYFFYIICQKQDAKGDGDVTDQTVRAEQTLFPIIILRLV